MWRGLEIIAGVLALWFYVASFRANDAEQEACWTRNAIFLILVAILAHLHTMGS